MFLSHTLPQGGQELSACRCVDVCFHVCLHVCAVTVTPGHYTVVINIVVAMGHCMQLGIEI